MNEGMKKVISYYVPAFLCLSLLGNCLSVCMLYCTKLRYKTSSIYLGALAMSDIGVLVTVFINWFKYMKIISYEYWMGILLVESQNLFIFLSVWIVVAFTVQRYIVIKWPLLRCSLCNVNRARNVVMGLAGLAVLYSIPWFIYKSEKMKKSNANEDLTPWWRIIITINFIITFMIPAIIIAIFNALIVYNIHKQNRIRKNLILNYSTCKKKIQSSDNEAPDVKVTKMLVIISSVFICLNAPLQVCNINISHEVSYEFVTTICSIDYIIYATNYGINFILYFATGKDFRKELIRIFTKCSDTKRKSSITSSTVELEEATG